MFFREFRYALLSLLRTKELIFWTLVFPFALSTFMFMAFGNLFETTEQFQAIPVAIVQKESNPAAAVMLGAVSQEGDQQLLKATYAGEEKAEKMLGEEEIKGIIYVGQKVSLKIKDNGMDQTILQMILNQFTQYQELLTDVGLKNPQKVTEVANSLSQEVDYFTEGNQSEANQDDVVSYFYAIFAMVCLFASFAGCETILQLQANMSPLGQRRSVAGMGKMKLLLADFAASELVQFTLVCLLLIYMKGVLGLGIGERIGAILLLLLVSTSFGIMFGILIGTMPRLGEGGKIGVLVSVNLAFCSMSDLMVSGVKDFIEHKAPLLNDINPAALITDSFYALNVFDTYDRFFLNLAILAGMTVVCGLVCYFIVRRNRYASI